jgi:hypothetical protein
LPLIESEIKELEKKKKGNAKMAKLLSVYELKKM